MANIKKKVRLTILFQGNNMFLDMPEEQASNILNMYQQWKIAGNGNNNACVWGTNFIVCFASIIGMFFGKIKIDPAEKWKESFFEDDEEDTNED